MFARHTLESVVKRLIAGLEDGSITYPAEWQDDSAPKDDFVDAQEFKADADPKRMIETSKDFCESCPSPSPRTVPGSRATEMPMDVYEFMFILDPRKVSRDMPGAVTNLHAVFEKYHCEILASRPWNEPKRLAFPIHNQSNGVYYLIYARGDSLKIADIERNFKQHESILRMLVIRIEPFWEDKMLEVAREEHALALQVAREDLSDVNEFTSPRRDNSKH